MQFYAHFPSLIHTHTHASFAKKTYEMPNEIPAEGERMPQVVACISSEVCSLPKGPNIIKTHTYVHTNIKCRKQNGAQLLPLKPVPKYQREPILLASTAMQATTYTSTTPTFVYQRWLKMKKIWVSQSKAINNACNQQWNWGEIVETKKLQRHLTLTLCGVALLSVTASTAAAKCATLFGFFRSSTRLLVVFASCLLRGHIGFSFIEFFSNIFKRFLHNFSSLFHTNSCKKYVTECLN